MGRRGPKPKTAEQLKLLGSHAPKQPAATARASGKPSCPRHLSLAAKRYWKQLIAPLVSGGWIGELDTQALARYCVLLARLDECERGIENEGLVTTAPTGQMKCGQYVRIYNDTARVVIQLEKELGLTPYSRRSLGSSARQESETEPAAQYFASG